MPGTFFTNVSNASGSYEGETGAASNGTTIVSGSNSIYPGACGSNPCYVKAYASSDGSTWTATQMPGTWHNTTFGISFDPALDYDTNGNYYFSFGGGPLSGNYPNSVAVAKSDPSGLVWRAPVAVTFNSNKFFDDKYWIAVDRSSTAFRNRIYVAWDRNTSTDQILYVSYSSDGGTTWSAPVKVDDGTSKFERVIGAYPAVDHATGTVYVSWHNYSKDIIYVDKSTNGGVSWGRDVAVAPTHTGFGVDIGCNGGRQPSPAHHLKVGSDGTLHVVYADQIAGKGFDILYTRSTDGGLTWSANQRLTTTASDFDGNANGPGDYSSSAPFQTLAWPFHSQHPAGGDVGSFEVFTFPFKGNRAERSLPARGEGRLNESACRRGRSS